MGLVSNKLLFPIADTIGLTLYAQHDGVIGTGAAESITIPLMGDDKLEITPEVVSEFADKKSAAIIIDIGKDLFAMVSYETVGDLLRFSLLDSSRLQGDVTNILHTADNLKDAINIVSAGLVASWKRRYKGENNEQWVQALEG